MGGLTRPQKLGGDRKGQRHYGRANISDIEVHYRRFLTIILKLGKATPNCMVYGEAGKMPLQLYVEKHMFSCWIKVSEDKESKILKKCTELFCNYKI